MAVTVEAFARELRSFRDRKVIINQVARHIRTAAKPVRAKIKQAAMNTLPRGGGLNRWVARIGITAQQKLLATSATIKLKGGRNAQGARADMVRIDAGRVRAPAWGHKTKAAWHNVSVTPGFFTDTADASDWRQAIDDGLDVALEQIRRG